MRYLYPPFTRDDDTCSEQSAYTHSVLTNTHDIRARMCDDMP